MGFVFIIAFLAHTIAFVILIIALFVLQIVVSFGQLVLTQMQQNQLKRCRENNELRAATRVGTLDNPWTN